MEESLALAIKNAGGVKALGEHLGISHQAVGQWRVAPPTRVLGIEEASGVSRHLLRPDIYPLDNVKAGTSRRMSCSAQARRGA